MQGQRLGINTSDSTRHLAQKISISLQKGNVNVWVSRRSVHSALVDGLICPLFFFLIWSLQFLPLTFVLFHRKLYLFSINMIFQVQYLFYCACAMLLIIHSFCFQSFSQYWHSHSFPLPFHPVKPSNCNNLCTIPYYTLSRVFDYYPLMFYLHLKFYFCLLHISVRI